MGLRRRGAWKNGETLERFPLRCWLFSGRVSAALSTQIRNYGDVFRGLQAAAGKALVLRRCMRVARSARVKVQRKGAADFS